MSSWPSLFLLKLHCIGTAENHQSFFFLHYFAKWRILYKWNCMNFCFFKNLVQYSEDSSILLCIPGVYSCLLLHSRYGEGLFSSYFLFPGYQWVSSYKYSCYIFFLWYKSSFSGKNARCAFGSSNSSGMFNFWKKLLHCFYSGCAISHPHQQHTSNSVSP